jgi:hypothetical protein
MAQQIQPEEARAGEKTGHVRWILGISLTSVVIAIAVYFIFFS